MDLPPSTRSTIDKYKNKATGRNTRFLKYGVPFLLLIVGGSFGLREFQKFK